MIEMLRFFRAKRRYRALYAKIQRARARLGEIRTLPLNYKRTRMLAELAGELVLIEAELATLRIPMPPAAILILDELKRLHDHDSPD